MPALEHVVDLRIPSADAHSYTAYRRTSRAEPGQKGSPKPGEIAGYIYDVEDGGQAEGVLLTHKNFCANVNAIDGLYEITPEDQLARRSCSGPTPSGRPRSSTRS